MKYDASSNFGICNTADSFVPFIDYFRVVLSKSENPLDLSSFPSSNINMHENHDFSRGYTWLNEF
jgi:hypothetical protein